MALSSRADYKSSRHILPPPVLAPSDWGLTYRIWAGGLRAASFDIVLRLEEGGDAGGESTPPPRRQERGTQNAPGERAPRYQAEVRGWLEGLPGGLIEAEFLMSAEGARSGPHLFPRSYLYDFHLVGRDRRTQEVAWLGQGRETRLGRESRMPAGATAASLGGTIDPLSFLASLVRPRTDGTGAGDGAGSEGGPCGPPLELFDGRYHLSLEVQAGGLEEKDFSRYGPYKGAMIPCRYHARPLGGFRDDEEARSRFEKPIEIHLIALPAAPPSSSAGGQGGGAGQESALAQEGDGTVWIPARLAFRTRYGLIIAYLQIAERGGRVR